MGVEADCSSCAGRADFAEHNRIAAGNRHQLRRDAPLLHHGGDGRRIALDVLAIAGDVRDRKQRDELVDDGSFVLLAPGAGRLRRRVRLGNGHCGQEAQQKRQQISFHASVPI